jgi:hypothetical protein
LFSCSCACLRERDWCNQRTSDCNDAFVHNPFPDWFLICPDLIAKAYAGLAEIGLSLLDQSGHGVFDLNEFI